MTEEATNTITPGQEAAPADNTAAPANAAPAGSQVTTQTQTGSGAKAETTSNEPLYSIKYRGQEEKLPISKLIDFAQQGRDYSEKMGQFNAQVEARAQELTDAAFDKYVQEQAAANHPAADPNAPAGSEELDEFTKLQKDVATLKQEREQKDERVKFEAEVEKHRKVLNDQLEEAAKKYPLANQRNILAVLRSNPSANVEELAKYEHDLEVKRQESWENDYLAKAQERAKRGAEGAGGTAAGITSKKLVLGQNTQEAVVELLSKQN
jgi:hypothetical protein